MSTDMKEDKKTSVGHEKEDAYSYKPRTRSHTNNKKAPDTEKKTKKLNKLVFIIPACIIVVLLACAVCLAMSLPKDKVPDNVYMGNVSIAGMNTDELKDFAGQLIDDDTVFTVKSSDKSTQIKASDIDMSVNVEETVNNAFSIGKSNNIFLNAYSAFMLLIDKNDVKIALDYDEEKLDNVLFAFGTQINGESIPAKYDFTESTMTITPGTPGQNADTSVAREEFLNAVSQGKKDDIEVTLDYADNKTLDLDTVYNEVSKEMQDASYEMKDNGKIIVHPHTVGVKIDKNDLKTAIEKVNLGEVATLPADVQLPSKTKEVLEANLFSTTLGTYTTDFSSSSKNRAFNVTRAANSINGKILMPGEVFSYNNAIGNPSAKNGYKMASVFQNGKSTQGVGGGVCQVSSTLYSAVLYADLGIVERSNHSLTVGYVPKGQDATVSYGSLDFKFKNNTDYPVKISSAVNGRKLTVSIIGGKYDPARKIEISHNLVSTIAPSEHVTEDAALPSGTRKVTSNGKNGYVVDSYKTVYENGKKVSSKKISRSTYKAIPSEVTVGTGTTPVQDVPQTDVITNNGQGFINTDPQTQKPQKTPEPQPQIPDENTQTPAPVKQTPAATENTPPAKEGGIIEVIQE